MITTIPIELQEQIYKSLDVNDRAKLLMALPKDTVKSMKCMNDKIVEKKLGIITRALKTKKLGKLTQSLHNFFQKCNKKDSTFDDIIPDYPELSSILQSSAKTLREKILDATVIPEDLVNIDNLYSSCSEEIIFAIYKCSPQAFDVLISHEPIRNYFASNVDLLFFNLLVNCSNEQLFDHVIANYNYDLAYLDYLQLVHFRVGIG